MKLLVIDEHPLLRDAIEGVLKRQFPSADISAVQSHGEARQSLLREPVDMVVANLLCCTPSDLEGLPGLVQAAAPGRVVVFGKCGSRANARRAQAAGVHGYVPASSRAELLGAALGLVAAGGHYFPELPSPDRASPAEDGGRFVERLSPRQHEVFRGLLAGQSNKAIARALGISVATVKLHVQAILRLAGARNRTEAVALASEFTDDRA
jgi:two-component system, NarL family, nitrate/nitrite response regulator NarL